MAVTGAGPQQQDVASAAIQALLSQVAPQVASDQAQEASLQQQIGAAPAQVNQANAYATAQEQLQQQNLGISEQQLNLQGQGAGLTTALTKQQQGYEQEEFGAQQKQAGANYQYALKNLQGQQAESGALGAPGQARDTANLTSNFQTQQQEAQLGQQSELAGYHEQTGGTFGGVNYGGGQEGLSQQNLSLMAQANGLSEQQLTEQLQYGLAQNEQSGITSVDQLLGQMGNLASGDVSTEATALAPIAYASGVNPLSGGIG